MLGDGGRQRLLVSQWRWAAAAFALLIALFVGTGVLRAAKAPPVASPEDRLHAVLDAFPGGLQPDQLDAVLAVMDDQQVREALRDQPSSRPS